MRKLLSYLYDYKIESVLAPLFKLLESLMDLLVPLVIAVIINKGIGGADNGIILSNFGLLICLAFLGMAFSFTAQWMAAKASVGFSAKLRQALFDHIQGLSFRELDTLGTDTLITRMTNDINSVQNGVNMVLRLLMRSPFIVFGAMIMAFTINVKAAIIFTLVIPALFAVVAYITFTTIPKYKNIQKKLDRLTLHVRENLSGARVIRAFDAADDEELDFKTDNDDFYKMNKVTAAISAVLNPATLILVNLALLAVIWQGGNLVNCGVLTNGLVVALINYMSQILVELVKLTNLFVTINKALASASRISATLDEGETLKDDGTLDACEYASAEDVVSFENVSFKYPGAGAESLEELTFDVKKGETVGIIGGTGSGKSTLANLIMRFYDRTGGTIKIFENPIESYTLSSLRKSVSYVPQKAQLFSGSVRDNLKLGCPDASDDRLWEALRVSEGKEIIDKKMIVIMYII